MKKSRIILISIVLLITIGVGMGLYLYNKPHKNIEKQQSVATVTATGLYNEFETDEDAANKKYLGNIIEVEGNIAGITEDENDQPVLLLKDVMFGVSCSFDEDYAAKNSNKIAGLKKGDTVVVKGRCDGMLTDVVLSRCIILNDQ